MVYHLPTVARPSQLDDSKIPARAFTVRCPKCQHVINAQPACPRSSERRRRARHRRSAVGKTRAPRAPRRPLSSGRIERRRRRASPTGGELSRPTANEVTNLLSALLQRAMTTAAAERRRAWGGSTSLTMRGWCAPRPYNRFSVARVLVENGHECTLPKTPTQAIERMRERKIYIVLLEPSFDPQEQGCAFIRAEIAALRPSARRRIFFVVLSPDCEAATRTKPSSRTPPRHQPRRPRRAAGTARPRYPRPQRANREFNKLFRSRTSKPPRSAALCRDAHARPEHVDDAGCRLYLQAASGTTFSPAVSRVAFSSSRAREFLAAGFP